MGLGNMGPWLVKTPLRTHKRRMATTAHTDWTEIAARNNADWCVTVWRSHGLPVRRTPGLIFCPARTPPFYPNAVTVSRDADPRMLAEFIAELRATTGDPAFSLKDSFAALDLGEAGLEVLFEARWIRRPAQKPSPDNALDWRRIEDADGLAAWETAWGQRPDDAAPIFTPQLLAEPRTVVAAGFDAHGVIRAGGIGHDAAGVVGLSNLFGDWSQAANGVANLLPGRELVGYESGDDLKASKSNGFSECGPLKVWIAR